MTDEPRRSSEDAVESGALDDDTPTVHPPEGEQEKSAESEETLSPDEKSTG